MSSWLLFGAELYTPAHATFPLRECSRQEAELETSVALVWICSPQRLSVAEKRGFDLL